MRRRADILPLDDFPEDARNAILEAVAQPKPPPKWLDLAGGLARIESRAWCEWHWARGMGLSRQSLPPEIRASVIGRDGYICGLCGDPVDHDDVHIDHILPVSLGGSDDLPNLQVTHSRCNLVKGARV